MPIYEYLCQSCGEKFEAIVRAASQPKCPRCQGADLRKQLSVFAVGSAPASDLSRDPCATCRQPGGPDTCPLR